MPRIARGVAGSSPNLWEILQPSRAQCRDGCFLLRAVIFPHHPVSRRHLRRVAFAGRFVLLLKHPFCLEPILFGLSIPTTAILPQRVGECGDVIMRRRRRGQFAVNRTLFLRCDVLASVGWFLFGHDYVAPLHSASWQSIAVSWPLASVEFIVELWPEFGSNPPAHPTLPSDSTRPAWRRSCRNTRTTLSSYKTPTMPTFERVCGISTIAPTGIVIG